MTVNLRETAATAAPPASRVPQATLPRVLYCLALDPGSKFGSLEEQIVFQAERFRQEGSLFAPLFITGPNADVGQFRNLGIDAHCLELRRFRLSTLFALRRLIRDLRIELVNWNFMPALRNGYVWALTLLTPGVRHWFTDHNSRPADSVPRAPAGIRRIVKRTLLRRYGRVVCVSQYVRECLDAQKVWPNLVRLPHFINTSRFRPDEAMRRQTRSAMNVSQRFVLLTVSQLIEEKGVEVAVRALAELPEQVTLWIIGDGPDKERLQRLVAELKLDGRVQLLGLQRQVQPFMQAADCYLCPSLWAEAAGLVNLEAQACAQPVIASRIGGIPEYVADGRTGLLFMPGDHHDLARCVRQLLDDPGLRDRLGQQGRIRALEEFSPEARLPEWLDLYRRWRSLP